MEEQPSQPSAAIRIQTFGRPPTMLKLVVLLPTLRLMKSQRKWVCFAPRPRNGFASLPIDAFH